jgi:hypothetical protein
MSGVPIALGEVADGAAAIDMIRSRTRASRLDLHRLPRTHISSYPTHRGGADKVKLPPGYTILW